MVRDRVRPVYIMKPDTNPEAPGKSGASEAAACGRKFTASVGGKKLTTPGDGGRCAFVSRKGVLFPGSTLEIYPDSLIFDRSL